MLSLKKCCCFYFFFSYTVNIICFLLNKFDPITIFLFKIIDVDLSLKYFQLRVIKEISRLSCLFCWKRKVLVAKNTQNSSFFPIFILFCLLNQNVNAWVKLLIWILFWKDPFRIHSHIKELNKSERVNVHNFLWLINY